MQEAAKFITSHRHNELESNERGKRRWSAVEVQAERWFQVETCSHKDMLPSVTTYIVPDLQKALDLIRGLSGTTWKTLRMYSRLPLHAKSGYVLETVERIFAFPDGTRTIFLDSGLVFNVPADNSKVPMPMSLAKGSEIYSRR